jgi:predicted metalloprotease with PDZ domain
MRVFLSLAIYFMALIAYGQDSLYHVSFDLRQVQNDRLNLSIQVPEVKHDSVEFHMPKIVPGTYSISDFGRFVTEFTALNSTGDTLESKQLDTNRWLIKGAKNLSRISYWVDDTFDKNDLYTDNYLFEPGGTSLEAKRGVFVLNTFGIIGYLDGYKFRPYEVKISHDAAHYGATSLDRKEVDTVTDLFTAQNYNFLADGPIMYCKPDTAIKKIDGAEIIISVFSPNKRLSAFEIMENIDDLIEAQTQYLGGKLPVNRYTYLIYLLDTNPLSRGMGALEHSYSSLYTLPEARANRIGQIVRDVAAHEFLHIVTPLNIHSEQIHNFNYIEPSMSQHLWLYEGVTEYSSMHVQVRNQLFDEQTFLENIKEKIQFAGRFPDVSFTEMSAQILTEEYEPMYSNVYYKGALIGMCLDLLLIHYSNGTTDLPNLISQLSTKYGPHRSFEDQNLIQEITDMTYPEIGVFFEKYVEGDEPLPLKEVLKHAGYDYQDKETVETPTLGNLSFSANENYQIVIEDVSELNDFGKAMGYQKGDIVTAINGQALNLENIQEVLGGFEKSVKPGDKIKVDIIREENGKQKTYKLKAKAQMVKVNQKTDIIPSENPSSQQLKTRNIWLNGLNANLN